MVIRKKFSFEGAHIVRNCSSIRCKKSIHGHGYVVEIFFTSKGLDNGQMVMDFGLMKGTIKDFIDGFDHAYSIWNKETDEFKDFMKNNSERWIEMPVSPSAEAYSLMFLFVIDKIIKATNKRVVLKFFINPPVSNYSSLNYLFARKN
jgi:6-pyruvoyltetrahydropterin/6-carboxytetrahydropterin synthase